MCLSQAESMMIAGFLTIIITWCRDIDTSLLIATRSLRRRLCSLAIQQSMPSLCCSRQVLLFTVLRKENSETNPWRSRISLLFSSERNVRGDRRKTTTLPNPARITTPTSRRHIIQRSGVRSLSHVSQRLQRTRVGVTVSADKNACRSTVLYAGRTVNLLYRRR